MDTLAKLEHDFPTFIYKTAQQYGLSKSKIHELTSDGAIEKIDRGIYIFPGDLLDEFSLISQKFSRGVFSLVSALIIHDLTDEMPLQYNLTFPQGYHPNAASLNKFHIQARYLSESRYSIGITTSKTENGGTVRVYSKKRTMLNIWESKQVQSYIKNETLKQYLASAPDATLIKNLTDMKNELYPNSTLLKVMEVYKQ